MKNEKIIRTWNQMNPDEEIKSRIYDRLVNSKELGRTNRRHSFMASLAAGITVLLILFCGCGAVYAIVPPVHEFVNGILFPRYMPEEIKQIENGHMTGSFDAKDVLLTFLKEFNRGEWEDEMTVKSENGFVYELYEEEADRLVAFVEGSAGTVIAVRMEKRAYADTTGLWQVSGYQVLTENEALEWKAGMTVYEENQNPGQEEKTSDTRILAEKDEMLLYNASDKSRIARAEKKDADEILSVLLGYLDEEETVFSGLTSYVIKTEKTTYFFDLEGHLVIEKDYVRRFYQMSREDLDYLLGLFEDYGILLTVP